MMSHTDDTSAPSASVTIDSDAPSRGGSRFFRLVPAFDSLRDYSLEKFRADLIAGLTVAAVAVPQAMAYASIFGVPVQYGLYTAIVMTAVGALFDSSKQLINGPTNAISIALLSALSMVPEGDRLSVAIFMALLIGLFQTAITLCRLGDLSKYISHAVIVGFTLGASVLLILDQLKNLLGLKTMGGQQDHFLIRFAQTMTKGGPLHGWTVALGCGTVVFVLILRWISRRVGFRIPDLLIGMITSAAVVWWWELDQHGVKVVGEIPRTLPSFQVPTIHWEYLRELAGSAAALALLGLLEAIAMAKAIAAHTRQKLDINQQCLSEGLANLAGSFFHCFPGSGSLTRSNINHMAGAVTQWSGVFSAMAVALTMLAFAPFARYIPRAALAGILMLAAWNMVDRERLAYHFRATRFDVLVVFATAISAVVVSVEFCIMIGTILSFILYIPRAARVDITELTITPQQWVRERVPADAICQRMRLYNVEGELFFGSAPDFELMLERIEREAISGIRVIVLRLKRARNPDAVCLYLLDEFLERLRKRNVTVLFCGVREDLYRVLEDIGIIHRLGRHHVFCETPQIWSATLQAIHYAYGILGDDVCPHCPRRQEGFSVSEDMSYVI